MAKKQKMTAKQREARIKAAQEREQRALAKKARVERTKKIFTVAVCIVLALALGVPTVALAFLAG